MTTDTATTMKRKPRAKKDKPTTSVTLGWVVKKKFYRMVREPAKTDGATDTMVRKVTDKVVSKRYTSHEAAASFRDLCEKYPPPALPGEENIAYYVTEVGGFDDLPVGM